MTIVLRFLSGSFLFLGLLGAVPGCGGPRFDGTEYRDDNVAFRLGPVPKGARTVKADDALVAFQDDENGATIAVSARCRLDGDDVPLRALAQHLFLQFTGRTGWVERPFRLDGRDALEVELDALLDGVPRHLLVTVLKKDGCVYDFIHIDRGGEGPGLVESREAFRRMVSGFHTVSR